ncbi:MAG TPA: hypothetical protein VEI46_06655 [Thermodesulfovibrionales bacterium]|nr:hypothetical protein [Thermodesulfovibrionales bacterium]
MKKIELAAIMPIVLASLLFLTFGGCAKKEVRVKANKEVVNLVKTWDKNLSFYTSKKNPLTTIENLRQNEIACWDWQFADKIQAFYNAAGTNRTYGNAVQIIPPHNVAFANNSPRLYLTATGNEPKLKDAVRVVFTE